MARFDPATVRAQQSSIRSRLRPQQPIAQPVQQGSQFSPSGGPRPAKYYGNAIATANKYIKDTRPKLSRRPELQAEYNKVQAERDALVNEAAYYGVSYHVPTDYNSAGGLTLWGQQAKTIRASVSQQYFASRPNFTSASLGSVLVGEPSSPQYSSATKNPVFQATVLNPKVTGEGKPNPFTKTASVSVPLGAVGSTVAAKSQPTLTSISHRPTSITDRNIKYVMSGSANYNSPIESKVYAQIAREKKQAEGLRRVDTFYRQIPGLGGDNYAQQFTREALALPVSASVGLVQAGQRGVLATQSYFAQPEQTKKVLKQGLKETPSAAISSFNPKKPSGLLNIGLFGLGAFGVARAARVSPIEAARTGGVARVSVNPARTLVTDRVPLKGTLNQAIGRLGTRTTTLTAEGKIRTTLVADPLLGMKGARVADTFKVGSTTFDRTVNTGGKVRSYTGLKTKGITPDTLSISQLDTKTLRQNSFENIQKNIVKQESVRRESGSYLVTLNKKDNIGTGFFQSNTRAVSELGPTTIVSRTRFKDLQTGEMGVAANRDLFQRELRVGGSTSSEQRARLNQRPIVNLDTGIAEQTSIVGRTPAPRTTYAQSNLIELKGVRARGYRSLGRRGNAFASGGDLARFDPLGEFQRTITRPREVARISPLDSFSFSREIPRVGARSSVLGGSAVLGFQAASRRMKTSPLRLSALQSSSRYAFDVDLRQATSSSLAQTSLVSFSRSALQSPLSTFHSPKSLFDSGVSVSSFKPLPSVVPAFARPPALSESNKKSSRKGTSRSYRPSRGLYELTFGKSLGRIAKNPIGGFTGLELTRSYNPKKRSRRKR